MQGRSSCSYWTRCSNQTAADQIAHIRALWLPVDQTSTLQAHPWPSPGCSADTAQPLHQPPLQHLSTHTSALTASYTSHSHPHADHWLRSQQRNSDASSRTRASSLAQPGSALMSLRSRSARPAEDSDHHASASVAAADSTAACAARSSPAHSTAAACGGGGCLVSALLWLLHVAYSFVLLWQRTWDAARRWWRLGPRIAVRRIRASIGSDPPQLTPLHAAAFARLPVHLAFSLAPHQLQLIQVSPAAATAATDASVSLSQNQSSSAALAPAATVASSLVASCLQLPLPELTLYDDDGQSARCQRADRAADRGVDCLRRLSMLICLAVLCSAAGCALYFSLRRALALLALCRRASRCSATILHLESLAHSRVTGCCNQHWHRGCRTLALERPSAAALARLTRCRIDAARARRRPHPGPPGLLDRGGGRAFHAQH